MLIGNGSAVAGPAHGLLSHSRAARGQFRAGPLPHTERGGEKKSAWKHG